jgi:5-methylcytosine-specific restriction endonuclease McrA
MPRQRTSIIWKIPKDEFQKVLDQSNSIVDFLKHFGLDGYTGNHRTFHLRIKIDNLCLKQLAKNRKILFSKRFSKTKIKDELIFCENSVYCRTQLKRRFLKIVDYECSECNLKDIYNGKPISLQLDHKNGINNDNRLENLRLLCPNCHSQTETFSGKRNKKEVVKVYESEVAKKARIEATRKFNPSREELEKLIKSMSMVKVGKFFGVSDNAVRKRCRLLGIYF